jgi:hypothetical protein
MFADPLPTLPPLELDLELDLPDLDAATATGLPQDRAARIAARRAFVEMKQLFLRAADDLPGHKGAWLGRRIRAAADADDLLQLRALLVAALREDEERAHALRAELYRSLDRAFVPDERRVAPRLGVLPTLPEAWQVWSGDVRSNTRFGALR